MKKFTIIFMLLLALFSMPIFAEGQTEMSADQVEARKTEQAMREANSQVGMPSVTNFQEKKLLKWIYELCDKEDLICHAYLFNSYTGQIGQYLGQCLGYGIPYST